MSSQDITGDSAARERPSEVDRRPASQAGADALAAAPLEIDLPATPSIPSGHADNDPRRPEAPVSLPPAAPPPSGQPASELQTEPASLEPPGAIAAEPMAPAPREARSADTEQPSLAVEEVQARADVSPQPEAARAAEAPPGGENASGRVVVGGTPAGSEHRGGVFEDAVTLLEISPAQDGGVTESRLPGNRAGSPPAPLATPRIGWNHPVARWLTYTLVVVALTLLFLWLLVDLFRVG